MNGKGATFTRGYLDLACVSILSFPGFSDRTDGVSVICSSAMNTDLAGFSISFPSAIKRDQPRIDTLAFLDILDVVMASAFLSGLPISFLNLDR